jgi:hypothetical protein
MAVNYWNPYNDQNDWENRQYQLNALKQEARLREEKERMQMNANPLLAACRPDPPKSNKVLLLL